MPDSSLWALRDTESFCTADWSALVLQRTVVVLQTVLRVKGQFRHPSMTGWVIKMTSAQGHLKHGQGEQEANGICI